MFKNLTVVIPTYNMENYLRKCLNSLIIEDKEMFKSLEVIVVNDGSSDDSSGIAHGYEKLYPEIFRVIDKPNGNYGSCINKGLQEATGKYIKILDADDYFDTENFIRFLRLLGTIDVDMVVSDYSVVSARGKKKKAQTFSFPKRCVFNLQDYPEAAFELKMHTVAYKVDNLRKINYWQSEGISYTDAEWIFYPMSTIGTTYYFDSVVYRYLVGRAGQTVDTAIYHKRVEDRVKRIKRSILFYEENLMQGRIKGFYGDYLKNHILSSIRGVYLSYLLVNRNIDGASSFDAFLHETAPDWYEYSSAIKINKYINYKYVQNWRNCGHLPSKAVSRLYIFLKRI